MLNFTEHMNSIINLAEQSVKHTQEEKFPMTRDHLIRISIHCNEALQQLDDLVLMQHQGKDPSQNLN